MAAGIEGTVSSRALFDISVKDAWSSLTVQFSVFAWGTRACSRFQTGAFAASSVQTRDGHHASARRDDLELDSRFGPVLGLLHVQARRPLRQPERERRGAEQLLAAIDTHSRSVTQQDDLAGRRQRRRNRRLALELRLQP